MFQRAFCIVKPLVILITYPNIQNFFPNNKETLETFSDICNHSSEKNKELLEFIKWHQDTNKQVIQEIEESQSVDFEDKTRGKIWAEDFLSDYDEKIRKMRKIKENRKIHKMSPWISNGIIKSINNKNH